MVDITAIFAMFAMLAWLVHQATNSSDFWEPAVGLVGLFGAYCLHLWTRSRADRAHAKNLLDAERSHAQQVARLDATIAQLRQDAEAAALRKKDDDFSIRNLRHQVHELEKERLRDLITGIPNQEKLKIDIAKYSHEFEAADLPYRLQLALIDIDGFSSINTTHGFDVGDKIITMIAQALHGTTRRTDEVYKREPETPDPEHPVMSRAYRSYKGGDEFIFILRGEQFEAIGFLNRVAALLARLSQDIEAAVKISFKVRFRGAVVRFYRGDSYEDATSRLYRAFSLVAKGSKDGLCLYWDSEVEAADARHPNAERRKHVLDLYAAARATFGAGSESTP